MVRRELGRIQKGKATIIEYGDGSVTYDDKLFIQIGIAGLYCNKKDLEDLKTVIDLYTNIENISQCKVTIEGEDRGWMAV